MSAPAREHGTGLEIVLEAPNSAVVGLPIIVSLSVVNRASAPRTVSARLNLIEGDVRVRVTTPRGESVSIAGVGGQPDTSYRQVTLPSWHEIRGGMNLQADGARTFVDPGSYTLEADYLPSPSEDWVSSPAVRLEVAAGTKAQRAAAALLGSDGSGAMLALGQECPTDTLRIFAERYRESAEGRFVRLMLAGGQASDAGRTDLDRIFRSTDPQTVALWITALSTPFSGVADRLAGEFVTQLERGDASMSVSKERAARIARGLPFSSK